MEKHTYRFKFTYLDESGAHSLECEHSIRSSDPIYKAEEAAFHTLYNTMPDGSELKHMSISGPHMNISYDFVNGHPFEGEHHGKD